MKIVPYLRSFACRSKSFGLKVVPEKQQTAGILLINMIHNDFMLSVFKFSKSL